MNTLDAKNVAIQIQNGTLTLKGERKFEQEKNGKGFHRIERSYGSFVRAFSLPETVDEENVKADYKERRVDGDNCQKRGGETAHY